MTEKKAPGAKTGTYKTQGTRGNGHTQTRYHMHIDPDLVDWFNTKVNRTRYLNDLIREDMNRNQ